MIHTALSVSSLFYSYKPSWGFKKVEALHDINFDIQSGEAFGFLGHNGAGKTTTIKSILGLIKPSAGAINILGQPNCVDNRQFVGYLPEQPYFYDHLSVEELIKFYGTLYGLSGTKLNQAAFNAIKTVGMDSKKHSRMRSLSKGLTQRVALAQAIMNKPKLLILDEPFSGLDPIGRKEFRDIMVSLKNEGTSILICSHILSDVEFLCDRVSIMSHGKIKGIYKVSDIPSIVPGSYKLVIDRESVDFENAKSISDSATLENSSLVLTFKDQELALIALKRVLDGGGIIRSYGFIQGNLEDLFISLVKFKEGVSHSSTAESTEPLQMEQK